MPEENHHLRSAVLVADVGHVLHLPVATVLRPIPRECDPDARLCSQQGEQAAGHRRQDRSRRTRDGLAGAPRPSRRNLRLFSKAPLLQPPELEIRDIGELTTDQFRGIFRLTYSGDAHLVLRTKVQVRATTPNSTFIV